MEVLPKKDFAIYQEPDYVPASRTPEGDSRLTLQSFPLWIRGG